MSSNRLANASGKSVGGLSVDVPKTKKAYLLSQSKALASQAELLHVNNARLRKGRRIPENRTRLPLMCENLIGVRVHEKSMD